MTKGFPWKNIDDRKATFSEASAYFNDVKDQGIKKIPKGHFGKNSPSFIRRDDGKILAIGSSERGFIAAGAFGRVKYAMDIDGGIYALKIETTNNEDQEEETRVAQDVGLMDGMKTQRLSQSKKITTGEKYYSSLFYLGDYTLQAEVGDLDAFSSNIRLKIADAKNLCWELSQLHTGGLSKTNQMLAHGDIKPSNIIRNEKEELKFVDYGLSAPVNREILSTKGTRRYMPLNEDPIVFLNNIQRLGRVGMDIFALKRTFYLPCSSISSANKNASDEGDCIFSDDEFGILPESLKEMIDTTDIERAIARAPQDTLCKLAMHFRALEIADLDPQLYKDIIDKIERLDSENQLTIFEEFLLKPPVDFVRNAMEMASELSSINGFYKLKEKYIQIIDQEDVATDSPTTVVNVPPSP